MFHLITFLLVLIAPSTSASATHPPDKSTTQHLRRKQNNKSPSSTEILPEHHSMGADSRNMIVDFFNPTSTSY